MTAIRKSEAALRIERDQLLGQTQEQHTRIAQLETELAHATEIAQVHLHYFPPPSRNKNQTKQQPLQPNEYGALAMIPCTLLVFISLSHSFVCVCVQTVACGYLQGSEQKLQEQRSTMQQQHDAQIHELQQRHDRDIGESIFHILRCCQHLPTWSLSKQLVIVPLRPSTLFSLAFVPVPSFVHSFLVLWVLLHVCCLDS